MSVLHAPPCRQRVRTAVLCAAIVLTFVEGRAQTPKPFPQPTKPATPPPTQPAVPTQPPSKPASPSRAESAEPQAPTEAMLGAPIYPTAQFITSYDAGRGQRFYIFGVTTPFADMVNYYRAALKQKGSELFDAPPTYQFEIGRFREETMAFPPSVTIKDYTWGGSAGYPNPRLKGQPERFATIIQIVPVPPGTPR